MKIKSLIILLLVSIFSFGQDINIDIKKSEIFKDKVLYSSLLYSENDGNNGLIIVKVGKIGLSGYVKNYYVEHYDSELNQLKKIIIENDKRSDFKGIFIKDGIINLIRFQYNSFHKNIVVSVLKSDVNSLSFIKEELFVLNEENFRHNFDGEFGLFNLGKMDLNGFGEVVMSANRNYISFSFEIKNKKKESHFFLVYNNDFKKVFQTKFERDIKDRLFDYENIEISDQDGTIYLLGKVFENNTRRLKKKQKTNYHYELFKITETNKLQISLKESEKFVNSFFIVHSNNELNLVGFYSEKNDYRFKGVCRYIINSNDFRIINSVYSPFTNQFFEDKYKKGNAVKKGKKELKNVEYRGVFLDEQDNIIINAEEYYETTNYAYTSNNFNTSSSTTYHFDDIISVKIDNNGELIWARNINKKQIGFFNSSYTSTIQDGNVYFFMNTSDKIKKLSNERIEFKQTRIKKSNLYVIKIDKKGDFTFQKLLDDKDTKVWYQVNEGLISTNNEVILQGKKMRKRQIIKLTIQ